MLTGKEFAQVVYGYWAKRFECDRDHFEQPGTLMILEQELEESGRTIIYQIGEMSVVRAAPSLAKAAGLTAGYKREDASLTADRLQDLLSGTHRLELTTTFLDKYLDRKDFHPFPVGEEYTARFLDGEKDHPLLMGLVEACTPEDLDEADIIIEEPDPVIIGIFAGSQLAAYASHRYWDDVIADIGVLIHPDYRSRGLGKAVVSALCTWCFENEIVPMYRVFSYHTQSLRLAESLGFKDLVVIYSLAKIQTEQIG